MDGSIEMVWDGSLGIRAPYDANNFVADEQASSLVLMSAVETTWHLATSSASALPTILVSVGSKVIF